MVYISSHIKDNDMNLPASYCAIKGTDDFVFLFSETSKLNMRPQIVQPS